MGSRAGVAWPWEWRILLDITSTTTSAEARATLVHELCHLHVDRCENGPAWHGDEFQRAMRRAMYEAYGVTPSAHPSLPGYWGASSTPWAHGLARKEDQTTTEESAS